MKGTTPKMINSYPHDHFKTDSFLAHATTLTTIAAALDDKEDMGDGGPCRDSWWYSLNLVVFKLVVFEVGGF